MPSPTLYTGSSGELVVGSAYKARQTEGHFLRPIELVMEASRPANTPSRMGAFFLVKTPDEIETAGGNTNFVYAVKPIGVYSKHHFGWMGRVYNAMVPFCRHRAPDEEKDRAAPQLLHLAEWADNYWEGIPYRAPAGEPPTVWEYLAPEIMVLGRAHRDLTTLEWVISD